MKIALSLLLLVGLTAIVFWPGHSFGEPLDGPVGERRSTRPVEAQLEPALVSESPELVAARTPVRTQFLDTVPFDRKPAIDPAASFSRTGRAPSLDALLPRIEWGIKTGGLKSFEDCLEAARHRVAPASLEHLIPFNDPSFAEAKAVYDAYLPRFDELSVEWAEADLRYRTAIWEQGLFRTWPADEPAPASTSGYVATSVQSSQGWIIWFAWERGISPEYDRVAAAQDALNIELRQQLTRFRTN